MITFTPGLMMNHMQVSPLLQCQLLLLSVILPTIHTIVDNNGKGDKNLLLDKVDDDWSDKPSIAPNDYIRLLALSNQVAITHLNHLATHLVLQEDKCRVSQPAEVTTTVPPIKKLSKFEKNLLKVVKQVVQGLINNTGMVEELLDLQQQVDNLTDKLELVSAVLNNMSLQEPEVCPPNNNTEVLQLGHETATDIQKLQEQVNYLENTIATFLNTTDIQNQQRDVCFLEHAEVLEQGQETTTDVQKLQEQVNNLTVTLETAITTFLNTTDSQDDQPHTCLQNNTEVLEQGQETATDVQKLQEQVNNLTVTLDTLETTITTFLNTTDSQDDQPDECFLESAEVLELGLKIQEKISNLTNKLDTHMATLTQPEPCSSNTTECPCSYFSVEGECFFVSGRSEKLDWAQARVFCGRVDSELATPRDPLSLILAVKKLYGEGLEGLWAGGEKVMMETTSSSSSTSSPSSSTISSRDEGGDGEIVIGDYDTDEEDTWVWLLSGSPVNHGWLRTSSSSSSSSTAGEPKVDQTCLTLSDMGLDGAYCGEERRFICQYQPKA